MKKVFFVLAVAVAAASCQPPKNEYSGIQKAIVEKLSQTHSDIESFVFTDYEVFDTVTMGEAINRCIAFHSKKAEVARKDAEKFRKEAKRKNAAKREATASYADEVKKVLFAIKDSLGRDTNSPLYYCVRFSGKTLESSGKFVVENCYVTIDENGGIYNMQYNPNGLHSGMNSLIPGYMSILKNGKDAE